MNALVLNVRKISRDLWLSPQNSHLCRRFCSLHLPPAIAYEDPPPPLPSPSPPTTCYQNL